MYKVRLGKVSSQTIKYLCKFKLKKKSGFGLVLVWSWSAESFMSLVQRYCNKSEEDSEEESEDMSTTGVNSKCMFQVCQQNNMLTNLEL